jgi:O-antigen ligase
VERLSLSAYHLLKLFELLLLMYYIKNTYINTSDFINFFFFIFISGLAQSLFTLIQFIMQAPIGLSILGEYFGNITDPGVSTIIVNGERIIRSYGTFPHPNVLAGFLLVSLISGFLLVSRGTKIIYTFVSCGTVIILIGLILTFSRTAWLGAGILIFSYIFYSLTFVKHSFTKYLLVSLIVFCSIILIFFRPYLFSRASNVSEFNSAVNYRISFNKFAYDLIKSNILLGVGVGDYIPTTLKTPSLQPWQHQPAHNIFLHETAELGLTGLVAFLLIIFTAIRSTWNSKNKQIRFVLLLGGFSIIIISLFDHYFVTIQQGQLIFFSFLGLMLAANNLNNDQHYNQNQIPG